MSFEYDEGDLVGSYVEDIWFTIDQLEDEPDEIREEREKHQAYLEAKWRERRRSFIQTIAHLATSEQIRTKTIKKILSDNIDFLAAKHIAAEHLNSTFSGLARQSKTLPVMIRGVLKECLGINFNSGPVALSVSGEGYRSSSLDTNERINLLCDEIYLNEEREIAYIRVSRIQRFIHTIADEKLGEGNYLRLSKPLMRQLLSAARLHLNLHDIRTLDVNTLLDIAKKSAIASDHEKMTPMPVNLAPSKTYVDDWRVNSLKSLFQVQVETNVFMNEVIQLKQLWDVVFDEDIDRAKEQALQFYRQYVEALEAK